MTDTEKLAIATYLLNRVVDLECGINWCIKYYALTRDHISFSYGYVAV